MTAGAKPLYRAWFQSLHDPAERYSLDEVVYTARDGGLLQVVHDMDELRKNLTQHIAEQTPRIAADREVDTQPTLGFQRVIQRAILHVQSSGKKEVTGANVLVAIFGEKESHAVYFLNQRGVTRLDVVNYIAHGITKTPQAKPEKQEGGKEEGEGGAESQGARRQVVALSMKHRLPSVYWQREYVDSGGLVSYGSSVATAFRRA